MIRLKKERAVRLPLSRIIETSNQSFTILQELFQLHLEPQEHFIVISLDNKKKVLGIQIVSVGSLNATITHPREVFRGAILHKASYIIISHNHPSKSTEPSQEDIAVTNRIKKIGEMLDIILLDHLIIGSKNSYLSFKDSNMI